MHIDGNDRPIGVFDSGLGGLTAVRRLIDVLPHENIIYLGDTARVPYGSRSKDTIIRYAGEDAAFLRSKNVKTIVVACNTVSSTAQDIIEKSMPDIMVFGVVEPPARAAAAATRNGRISVLGTAATVRSGAYKRELEKIDGALNVLQTACPLFVPLVENGRISKEDPALRIICEDYLAAVKEFKADTVILGCTHYPLLSGVIGEVLGDGVTLIDSGAAAADTAAQSMKKAGILSGRDALGELSFFVTDVPESFRESAELIFGRTIEDVVKTDLG